VRDIKTADTKRDGYLKKPGDSMIQEDLMWANEQIVERIEEMIPLTQPASQMFMLAALRSFAKCEWDGHIDAFANSLAHAFATGYVLGERHAQPSPFRGAMNYEEGA